MNHNAAVSDPSVRVVARRRRQNGALARRLAALIVAAVVLYGLAPATLEVLGAYRRLQDVDPGWWIAALASCAAGMWCMCALQRLALNRPGWFPVVSSQLAGTAFSKVVPGGSAAAAALQARMLAQAGLSPATIGTGLTAGALLLLSSLAGLPLLAAPALLLGRQIPDGLLETAAVGLGVFVGLFALGALLLINDRALRAVALILEMAQRRLRRRREQSNGLTERLFGERALLRRSLGGSWPLAVATAAGRWIFDFLCLYCSLVAVGARPPLYVALLAYSAAQLLGQIPLTPGGLGVVEAGLTGTLALAGVAAAPAALATLAYRLASYWLPLPAGLLAWIWHRSRYGRTPLAA
ncbi:MAG TPA: lysylphosphatidylglycerol synthase transmembrane domain-containing protein [Dehalococcoidia bacterium]|nr:lysylphosphatidylglycerol synthase transmembrane domain-containing protein [Dehalococcoidia bacterium]